MDMIENHFYNFRINVYQSFSNTKLNVVFTLSGNEKSEIDQQAALVNHIYIFYFISLQNIANTNQQPPKKMKKLNALPIMALAIITLIGSCSERKELPPPNIVWITSEDNSVHYMGMYDENGAETPNIASLAKDGLIFRHAFSNAPVCSAARSTIISGCYGPRIGANFHRKIQAVPMPSGLEMFPAYLRSAGYYTTNNAKEDYNMTKSDSVWDESSNKATWKNRAVGQPFFHVFNIHTTHESKLHFTEEQMKNTPVRTDVSSFAIFPNHPKTELFEYTNAYYRDKIMEMDRQAGEVIAELKAEGLLDRTFIFYYGDHGGVLPGSKGYLYETGLHVPMVVHIPKKYRHLADFKPGSDVEGFVSFIDLAPTILNLAGVEIPQQIDGKPFLGKGVKAEAVNSRDEAFGYADRFDEKYDMVRSLRKGNYKYIRSYQPFIYDGLHNNYRYIQLAYREWLDLHKRDELNEVQSQFFRPRSPELLFDLAADPYETADLSGDPAFQEVLEEMRGRLNEWVKGMPDLSFYPENYLIGHVFDDPVSFGRAHGNEIAQYIEIANLQLLEYEKVKDEILVALNADDPWQRYWGLIVSSTFGKADETLVERARAIASGDPQLLNRVKAAEYLGLTAVEDPVSVMTAALSASRDAAEATLIMNSIVLMQDGEPGYDFDIRLDMIDESIRDYVEVKKRIEYLMISQ
jgi:arylsulfatase A-like enzyme